MTVTMLIWAAVIVAAIVLLDLARHPMRRFLIATATLLARITCGLRTQLVRLRDRVGRWHGAHLARLEAAQLADAIDALERDYARLIGHDLAQLPALRQDTHQVVRELEAAYAREETGLTDEPPWVQRLEVLARTPAGDQPQSQRLARDMQETVLRIARLALEEHRQHARELVNTRRRLQEPLAELVSRLASLQERLVQLQRQAQSLDGTLQRFERHRGRRSLRLPVYAHSGGQWVLSAAGLALAGLAVYVYQQVFAGSFDLLFQGPRDPEGRTADLAIWALLGTAGLSGWILAETRAATPSGLTPIGRLAALPRTVVGVLAGGVLLATVIVSMVNGYLREWLIYRAELFDVLMAGNDAPPIPDVNWVAQLLGGLLGLVLPLVVALAPLWLVGLMAATRVLFGAALWFLLALLAGLLRWLAGVSCHLRRWLPAGFDLLIFLPESVRRWRSREAGARA
ncbi:hypothetical protein [Thioalkalivibrio paradoxus]|nr:hypothetical protein [Thioalkalivibrio paradoxus]